jgi:predicted Zn-dependent protease with MMP-like domain
MAILPARSDDETDEPLLPIPTMVIVNEVAHRTGLCDDPFSL